ncbi:MAG TPA: hypothetical protein VJ553_05440 [Candidatus Paceibacterota bacterium]|nr:hypothetical protein [Candidatus Paceibacterota bacterium]
MKREKLVKVKSLKPKHFKSLLKVQYTITYIDSDILGPTGRLEPLINVFECDGQIVQSLPKQFRLCMQLVAVPVRGKKPPTVIMLTPGLMDAGKIFHRPYTKKEIAKMRADERERGKELEKADYCDD